VTRPEAIDRVVQVVDEIRNPLTTQVSTADFIVTALLALEILKVEEEKND
jgi:hypothetical protein